MVKGQRVVTKSRQVGMEYFRKEEVFLRIMRAEADNAGALAWLEYALEHARDRGQRRLENLLETVRTEIVLEIKLTPGMLAGRPPTDREIGER